MMHSSTPKFVDGLNGNYNGAGIHVLKTIETVPGKEGLRRLVQETNQLIAFFETFDAIERSRMIEKKLIVVHG